MSLGKFFFSFFQSALTDFVFKRPVTLKLERKADGSFDINTQINPSNAQPTNHIYYGTQPGYGFPMQPMPAFQPQAVQPMAPSGQPQYVVHPQPMAQQSNVTIPEDFKAS